MQGMGFRGKHPRGYFAIRQYPILVVRQSSKCGARSVYFEKMATCSTPDLLVGWMGTQGDGHREMWQMADSSTWLQMIRDLNTAQSNALCAQESAEKIDTALGDDVVEQIHAARSCLATARWMADKEYARTDKARDES